MQEVHLSHVHVESVEGFTVYRARLNSCNLSSVLEGVRRLPCVLN